MKTITRLIICLSGLVLLFFTASCGKRGDLSPPQGYQGAGRPYWDSGKLPEPIPEKLERQNELPPLEKDDAPPG
ncbi:MAG: hypothetical protein AAGF15_03665 [Pseudomonadota bacterium]